MTKVSGKFYTGIGSRQTPPSMHKLMKRLASKLEKDGYILRSGGAEGADQLFECGVKDPKNKNIYLPWEGFMGRYSENEGYINPEKSNTDTYQSAKEIALNVHPNPNALEGKQSVMRLHTRNVYQILGDDLETPSKFVILWAPPTQTGVTGGTNTAYQIAERNGVPIFNLFMRDARERLEKYLEV